ncbi:MAG: PAS domain S-box protein, partial [Ignavibacteriaceae bacterium]|nr:PAS domain S-box protein [Ignavibacteriaceae bacterium]
MLTENIRVRKETEETLKNKENELEKYQAHLESLVNERTKNLEIEILERSKVEKALKESEEKYKNILEFAAEAFFQGDSKGNLIIVNSKAVELTGYAREELLSFNLADLFPKTTFDAELLRYDLLQEGKAVITEREILTKNGSRLLIEMNSKKMPDGTYQSFFRNITERKNAEEILKRTQEHQTLILQSLPMVYYTTNVSPDLNTTWISDQVEKIAGFLPKDFSDSSVFWTERIHPVDREATLNEYKKVFSTGSSLTEYRWKCADGNYRWFSDRTALVKNESGQPHLVVGMWLDITEKKQAEDRLLKSEERFRLISNLTSDYIFSTKIASDGSAEPDWVMGAFENITGYTFDEYKKVGGWRKVVHPDDREKDEVNFNKLFTNEVDVSEIRTIHKQGRIIWLRSYAQPIWDNESNKLVGVYGAVQDITERKHAEEYLIESETKLRKIAEGTKAILFSTNKRGQFTYANKAASEVLELENKKLIGKFYLKFIHPDDRERVHSYFQQQLNENEKDRSLDFRYISASGRVGWLSFLVNTLSIDGNVTGLTGVAQEITERKQTEEALRKSETQYRNLFETANDAIIIFEPESEIILEANSNACKIYDFTRDEIIGLSLKKLTVDIEAGELQIAMTMKNKGKKNFETREYTRTGKIIYLLVNTSVIEYEGKTAILSINHDITERKIAEEKLIASELQFRSVWENSTDGMRITDGQGIILMVNNAFCKLVEMQKAELEGKPLSIIYNEENREHISEMHKKRLLSKTVQLNFERELTLCNNKKYWFDVTNSYLEIENQPTMLLSIFRDITERKLSEFELKKLSEAVEQSPASVVMTDVNGIIQYVNKSFSEISEYSFDEVIGKHSDMFSSDYNLVGKKDQLWETVLAGNLWRGEFLNKKKSGKLYWEDATIKAVKDKEGKILSILFVKEDITLKKNAEQEIQLLAHSIESIGEGVSITDVEDQILFVNDAFIKIYGYSRDELIGKDIRVIRQLNEMPDEMNEIVSGTVVGGWKGEIINRRKDGSLFPVYLSTSVVKDHNGIPVALIGVATDITDTKKAHEELVLAKERAEKANTLKTEFLAQMSHEIRSPMNVTLSFASLIREELEEVLTPELIECFKGIDYAGKRLIRTVDLILNMSEVQLGTYEPTWSEIDLNADILERVRTEYISLAKRKGLEFNYIKSIPNARVYGDHNSLN